jgi:hypothetical protein
MYKEGVLCYEDGTRRRETLAALEAKYVEDESIEYEYIEG